MIVKVNDTPLVSVLMTAYNRQHYIREAIESVLSSTYTNFELIIVDDASTDDTVSISNFYAEKDCRVKVYVNQKNLGDYQNRNKAASYAKGEYIMYLDSDDVMLKDGIKKCVEAMQKFPESGFGLYNSTFNLKQYALLSSKVAISNHFFKKPFLVIGPGGSIQRKSYFDQIKQFPTRYGPANDMYHNLKAACFSPIVLIPFEFMFYRRHEGQEINNKYSYLYNNYNYLQDALRELPLPLSGLEKKWIQKKNKRRFTFNIIIYFINTLNFKKTLNAIRLTNFKFLDIIEGVF